MTDTYYYGDYTRKQQRDIDRNRSRENAENTSHVNSDDEYMKQLGKEGIKRQQEHMLSKAEDVGMDHDAGAYVRKHGSRLKATRRKGNKKKRAVSKR